MKFVIKIVNSDVEIVDCIFFIFFLLLYSETSFGIDEDKPKVVKLIIIIDEFIVVAAIPYSACVKNLPAVNQNKKDIKLFTIHEEKIYIVLLTAFSKIFT